MRVLEYRYISISDPCDLHYDDGFAWSRVYEYPLVKNYILQSLGQDVSIHNTSWGFTGVHRWFRDDLEATFKEVVSSDYITHGTTDTYIYDVTCPPPENFKEAFDVVINISAIEEITFDPISIVQNLFQQVKPNGYLILTFDIPGLDIVKMNSFLGRRIQEVSVRLNGFNSALQNTAWGHLNCGFLVIKKV